MHIVVIGAGVVGVTTAWALHQRGHQVTVIERLEGAGQETSKGNAGQRSYGVVYPWASAAMVRKALPWLLDRQGPLKMRMPPSLNTLRFLLDTLRFAYAPGVYGLNKRAMLRLGMHSRTCFQAIEDAVDLSFDGEHAGILHLASTPAAMTEYADTAALLDELAIESALLTPDQVREVEPGMRGDGPLFGALQYRTDGTGDCHLFSQALARACGDRGVRFLYNTTVRRLVADYHRVNAVEVTDSRGTVERIEADAVVMSAGCASPELLRPLGLHLPLYPVKGYSLTAPLVDPERAPRSTVHDDNYKVVSTRLGDRLRATGFVELADFDRRIHEARLETIRTSVASRFPGAADMDEATTWTGFRPMTPDGPPAIGRGTRDNLYLNTGHGTFGWTLSAGSAELIAQVIDGEAPALDLDPFRPGRFAE
ncbi:FAD-dependent oxidoreductase [Marinobacter halodurans]|uniref:FAD-dependent oxidoreductase n=1 Tax=Marinobacter halodurans TaxID=2528979 RepID=A0ABY1ZSI1_9GAMM|nr:D-amino acid dehydrogenase [Marinobacter halodurans]TBW58780.1 FAD-dependent oxidoreductase [Marinobacter halodurans]